MIKIKIPATSANIGAGFDSLGIALNMSNSVNMQLWDSIDIKSLDGVAVPCDNTNLIYKTVKYVYDLCGKPLAGLKVEQTNAIPMARGLGSSSACIVAGVLGANTLMGNTLSQSELIDLAARLEGHPDNSTPAITGGLVTAAMEDGKVYYVKQALPPDLRFAAIIPDYELKTSKARGVIPKDIAHKDAVFNLSRAALMTASLCNGEYRNLRVACDDRLHQPYRLPLVEGGEKCFDIAYSLGAYAVYISGAGSTLMAITNSTDQHFESKMRSALNEAGYTGWRVEMLCANNFGATVE